MQDVWLIIAHETDGDVTVTVWHTFAAAWSHLEECVTNAMDGREIGDPMAYGGLDDKARNEAFDIGEGRWESGDPDDELPCYEICQRPILSA